MARRVIRSLLVVVAWTACAVVLTACDPPPAVLVVTTTVEGADAAPGDGVCEVTAGAGDCTLRAAVEEGNALGRAAITVPAGTYQGPGFTVTGDLSINRGAPTKVELLSQAVTVAAGGRLVMDGVYSYNVPGARIIVEGTFEGHHLSLVGLESIGQLWVKPGGTAVVDNSTLAHVFGATATVRNEGTILLGHVSLLSWVSFGVATTAFANSGTAYVATSALQSCGGTDPVSLGYSNDSDGTCGLAGPGDQPSAPPAVVLDLTPPVSYDLATTSPLVDAVPVGVAGCGSSTVDDMAGAPRPVDGNGDGIVGCDIGARERQPTAQGGRAPGGSSPGRS